jgi:hypothetical protein
VAPEALRVVAASFEAVSFVLPLLFELDDVLLSLPQAARRPTREKTRRNRTGVRFRIMKRKVRNTGDDASPVKRCRAERIVKSF